MLETFPYPVCVNLILMHLVTRSSNVSTLEKMGEHSKQISCYYDQRSVLFWKQTFKTFLERLIMLPLPYFGCIKSMKSLSLSLSLSLPAPKHQTHPFKFIWKLWSFEVRNKFLVACFSCDRKKKAHRKDPFGSVNIYIYCQLQYTLQHESF